VVVNDALAKQLFPGVNPIGRRIGSAAEGSWREIVGVVGNVRQRRLEDPPKPEYYTTFAASPMPFLTVVVKTRSSAANTLNAVRDIIRQRDPGLAVANLAPLEDYLAERTSNRRFALTLLGLFAGLALLLGAVGLYGVMSYAVAARQKEIAIRLALGAGPGTIRAMVIADGLVLAGTGVAAGLLAALLAGRLIQNLLFGTGWIDLFTYGAVPAVLGGVAILASWLPARRASRLEALSALQRQ
jgi:ABC-type antimicrobial peptide transport system permease subunit